MLKFIIQAKNGRVGRVEEFELIKELDRLKFLRQYEYILSETPIRPDIEDIADYIPVGTIEYCEMHLKEYFGIEKMIPIEVPEELRVYRFLKRNYTICSRDELPDDGYWFIKKIDRLKEFTNLGAVGLYKHSLEDGTYVVSEPVEIYSEYRVFVLNGVLQGVQFYQGDNLEFPSADFIRDMIREYQKVENRPSAYTMDIAVTDRGNVLLEVHSFVSC